MGKLEVITGPMFSGKSAHLLSLLSREHPTLRLVPSFDTRSGAMIRSRTGAEAPARTIRSWPDDACNYRLVLIDEAHFFTAPHYKGDFVDDVRRVLKQGVNVAVAGLDFDYLKNPFQSVHHLMHLANHLVQLKARCHICAEPASWTMKRHETSRLLEAGDTELYRACCADHWALPKSSREKVA